MLVAKKFTSFFKKMSKTKKIVILITILIVLGLIIGLSVYFGTKSSSSGGSIFSTLGSVPIRVATVPSSVPTVRATVPASVPTTPATVSGTPQDTTNFAMIDNNGTVSYLNDQRISSANTGNPINYNNGNAYFKYFKTPKFSYSKGSISFTPDQSFYLQIPPSVLRAGFYNANEIAALKNANGIYEANCIFPFDSSGTQNLAQNNQAGIGNTGGNGLHKAFFFNKAINNPPKLN